MASSITPMHFKIPYINYTVDISMPTEELNQMSRDINAMTSHNPEQFHKTVENIKLIVSVALTALAVLVTCPVWIPGMMITSSLLGAGIWIATPFMAFSLWHIFDRVVTSFHQQFPVFIGSLAADWVENIPHNDNVTSAPMAAAAPARPSRNVAFGDDTSHLGASGRWNAGAAM